MMPPSYREPDEPQMPEGERLVYFDYARSLENRKRPIRWRRLALSAVLFGIIGFVIAAMGGRRDPPSLLRGVFFGVPAMFLALGLIPIIRSNRALSGSNFAEAKRRRGK